MTIPKELKEAISNLPSKEKDKLIFRLLRKDVCLANRLLFELVSDQTIEGEREKIKKQLTRLVERSTLQFYSPGYLNLDVREMSGMITEHVSRTKDKYGEISLNLYMITEILERNRENILRSSAHKAEKFCAAVIARAFKILLLIKKMHEDYFVEFEDDVKKLGSLIGDNDYLMRAAMFNGLNVNWLISGDIPDDIEKIHKDVRQRGYLK
ncbi:MAG: hypothetical protein LBM68_04080 [Bacteroidales bacterium]|jgi:hypothetical protein|nr:hypothetical protein [Bacteroidales bacterium]